MTIPYTFTNGTVANANEVNSNFTAVLYNNRCKEKVPTLAGTWDTSPTNLNNITDEDLSTGTGTGTVAESQQADIVIDLGQTFLYHRMYVKFDYVRNSNGAFYVIDDNSIIKEYSATANVSEFLDATITAPRSTRYITLRLSASSVADTIKIYEICLW